MLERLAILLFIALSCVDSQSYGQTLPIYYMSDTLNTECKGRFKDSENGQNLTYDNNEDYTFVICTGGPITMVFFSPFCTEAGLDILSFYDGPTVASPLIASYSGTTTPATVVANSGCLTIHFVSDNSVSYCGWDAQWSTVVPPPVPPNILVNTSPTCNSFDLILDLDKTVSCDSIYPAAFTVVGLNNPNVIVATALNCVANETQQIQLTIDQPFDQNCTYDVTFNIQMPDACDSMYTFTQQTNFILTSCPLTFDIEAINDTLCPSACTDIEVVVDGCLGYTYLWSDISLIGAGPHTICPLITSTYIVTVTENASGGTVIDSIIITVLNPQITLNDTTICQSDLPFLLTANPAGGLWTGAGISDSASGMFYPDSAGPGTHIISYSIAGACSDNLIITIDSMNPGPDEAACPGSPAFQVQGFTPIGGTWSGPFITAVGLFDPTTIGTHVITYTSGNCIATKNVNVGNFTFISPYDTICQSHDTFSLSITPTGGYWDGTHIRDSITGLFQPREGPGTIISTYYINGCQFDYSIEILPLDIGYNTNACPSEAPYQLFPGFTPPGGVWSGSGITDPILGIFDPAIIGDGNNDTIIYVAPNGCVDTIINYVRITDIAEDTLFYCISEYDSLELDNDETGRIPWGGVWTGTSVTVSNYDDYFFHPSVAGPGVFILVYNANGCLDSMIIVIYPDVINFSDTSICSNADSIILPSLPIGAYWFGDGIIDPSGIFSPATALYDTSLVIYSSPFAECRDTIKIEVIEFLKAFIGNLDTSYCFTNTDFPIGLSPNGGVFSSSNDSIFNPSVVGAGIHYFQYIYGSGTCQSIDSVSILVLPELITTTSGAIDSICEGEGTLLEITASGGSTPGVYDYNWDNGLFPYNSQNVSPAVDQWYFCTTSDGCSDPVIDSFSIIVHPPFSVQINTSNKNCYGEDGYALAIPSIPGNYSFNWAGLSDTGDSIIGSAGQIISLSTINTNTGCEFDTLFKISSYNAVKALFITNPNEDCIPFDQRNVTFLDLSQNVTTGKWLINGKESDYVLGTNPTMFFENPGIYEVELRVENEGGCKDSSIISICIDDNSNYFIPDIFSPNGDANNDVFYVRARNIKNGSIHIYDRWGELVFETKNFDIGWDGTVRGEKMPTGSYLYLLDITYSDNKNEIVKGDISLVR